MLKARNILMFILAGIAVVLAGCDSYADKKAAARQKLEATTAQTKVAVANDLFENGRTEEAEAMLLKCLEVDPEMAHGHLLMGRLRFSQSRLDDAEKSFRMATDLDANMGRAWYCLGVVAQRNKSNEAFGYYYKAMTLEPGNVDYIIAAAETYIEDNRYDAGLKLLDEKNALLGGEIRLQMAKADILLRFGKVKEAINVYNQILLKQSNNAETTEALAYCYIIDKDWGKAVEMFESLASNPGNTSKNSYLKMLAMCSMNASEYGKAVSYYDQLSVEQRDSAEVWLQMGQAALGAGAPRRALSCAQRALTLRPGWAEAIVLRGCAQYANKNYTDAIDNFREITSDSKMSCFGWLMMGRCYQRLGEKSLMEKAYSNVAKLDTENKFATLISEQTK